MSRGVAGLNLGVPHKVEASALEPAVSLLGVERKQSPTQISTTALVTTARRENNREVTNKPCMNIMGSVRVWEYYSALKRSEV